MTTIELVFLLLAWHAVADYPLQGDFLASAKDPASKINEAKRIWPHALAAHSAIHAGGVFVITGSVVLGAVEFVLHAVTDFGKCTGWYGYHTDQALHVLTKVAIVASVGVLP